MSTATFDRTLPRPSFSSGAGGIALALIALGGIYLTAAVTWRQGALFVVGVGAGIVLYHAAFGFTSSWRVLIREGRGAGLRAQMLMLAVTCTVFLPVLARGHMFGQPVRGAVAPVSLSVLVGAFLFGVGMQLGGGCASGTLYTVGGGSVRMIATLAAFIVGSVIGARHMGFWDSSPAFKPISLVSRYGPSTSLLMSLAMFAAIALISLAIEHRRHGSIARNVPPAEGSVWLKGPWPLTAGALGLAGVNIFTLALSGRPWGVTFGFALWGSKLAGALGANVPAWP